MANSKRHGNVSVKTLRKSPSPTAQFKEELNNLWDSSKTRLNVASKLQLPDMQLSPDQSVNKLN